MGDGIQHRDPAKHFMKLCRLKIHIESERENNVTFCTTRRHVKPFSGGKQPRHIHGHYVQLCAQSHANETAICYILCHYIADLSNAYTK